MRKVSTYKVTHVSKPSTKGYSAVHCVSAEGITGICITNEPPEVGDFISCVRFRDRIEIVEVEE